MELGTLQYEVGMEWGTYQHGIGYITVQYWVWNGYTIVWIGVHSVWIGYTQYRMEKQLYTFLG